VLGSLLESLEQWRRVAPRAVADEGNKPVDRERLPLLCLPTPAVTCKTTKNAASS